MVNKKDTSQKQKTTSETQQTDSLNARELYYLTHVERLRMLIRSHDVAIKGMIMSGFAALLLAIVVVVMVFSMKKETVYFATTNDGQLISLQPLYQPLLSLHAVEDFTARVISNTFTFDYANYSKQITANAVNYTPDAFTDIKKELQGHNGLVHEAVDNNWIVTATIMSAPQVVKTGLIHRTGIYGWRLIYPVMMTFQNERETRSAQYDADVLVIRVNQKDSNKGIAIKKLILTPHRA